MPGVVSFVCCCVVIGVRIGAPLHLAFHVTGIHGAVFVVQAVIEVEVAEFSAGFAALLLFSGC